MKLLHKPFAIAAGIFGAKIAQSLFEGLWTRIDTAAPPTPVTRDADFGKVVVAAVLRGATLAGTQAVLERASARYFYFLTGVWPGEEAQPPRV